MNTISIDSNIYKGAELYAKLHNISVEAVIEKGLTLLLENLTSKKKVADENAEFQKALAYVESLTVKGGKPVPADVDSMSIFVDEKYRL